MHAEKFRLANSVAEMVIVHWRDIVRQMRHFGALHSVHEFRVRDSIQKGLRQASLAPFGSQRPGTLIALNVFLVSTDSNSQLGGYNFGN